MDKVKVSRAAASLVARGLLRQTQDPRDGRARLLRLTCRGATAHRGGCRSHASWKSSLPKA